MARPKLTQAEADVIRRWQPLVGDLVERAHADGMPRAWFMKAAAIQFDAIEAMEEGMREKAALEQRGEPK